MCLICTYRRVASRAAQNEPASPIRSKAFVGRLSASGTTLFLLVLLLQVPYSPHKIIGIVRALVAALDNRNNLDNRTNSVSSILAGHPEHKQRLSSQILIIFCRTALICSNPTLMSEQRYGNVVHFASESQLVCQEEYLSLKLFILMLPEIYTTVTTFHHELEKSLNISVNGTSHL